MTVIVDFIGILKWWNIGGSSKGMAVETHVNMIVKEEHRILTTILLAHRSRCVHSAFNSSNPVWEHISNVRLLPKLAHVLGDWLKYCILAVSDHPELSANPIR